MIKIDNRTNIQSIEDAYRLLSNDKTIDIVISKGLSSADFGLIPALIQFFACWFHNTQSGKIIFNIKSVSELTEIYDYDYVFPIIVYCWTREIVDSEGKDLKSLLKTYNHAKHEKMRKQLEGGGQKVMLSCFDHLSVKNGLLPAFYTDGVFIANEMLFDYAIEKSIRQATSLNLSLRSANFGPVYEDIIAVIYELMKNTDDWGRTDEFNKPLNPNTRGLFLKFHRRKRESFLQGFEGNDGLKNYFAKKNFEANAQDELYFLELSVFDTGIGFVRRNVGESYKGLSSAEQVDIVRFCLVKNNTSATGIEKTIKGQGLNRIMQILDNKGLFWLRTQNISVFRNLRDNRYKEGTTGDDIVLYDWFKNSTSSYTKLEPVLGSVITLVYPISNLQNA